MAGGAPSVTAAQSYALMDLAALARDDAAALAWLRAPDRRGSDWRDALPPDSPFRRAFAHFLSATAIAPSTKPICVIRAGAKRRIICWTAC